MSGKDLTNLSAGLILPLTQAIVTGAMAFVLTLASTVTVVGLLSLSVEDLTRRALSLAFLLGAVITVVTWLKLRSKWSAMVEVLLGVDLNGDGVIGDFEGEYVEPEPSERHVKVFVHDGPRTKVLDVPVDYHVLARVSKMLLDRGTFSYADFAGPQRPLVRSQWEVLREEFTERGILTRPQHSNAPYALSRSGRAALEAIVRDYASSPPPQ